ncbi:MAG: transposase [Magnetococcales bacterium]|nr:transposase [Magnetococcales bacterium]
MKLWLSAQELAGLPDLPGTDRNVRTRADQEGWRRKKAEGTRGWLYHISSIPTEAKNALVLRQEKEKIAAALPIPQTSKGGDLPKLAHLKDWQREKMEARLIVLAELKRMEDRMGQQDAMRLLIEEASMGLLPENVQSAVSQALGKTRKDGLTPLSASTLHRWRRDAERGPAALAPLGMDGYKIPDWAPTFLKLYQIPSKPTITAAYHLMQQHLPAGVPMPSLSQVRRFEAKMGRVEIERGRMGPRALKNIRGHTVRDFSDLRPGDVFIADGHTFDAEVAHPAHGRPFRPEITTVLDVAKRRCVGFSIGLSESSWVVADALRNAVETAGVPAIFYTDGGSGYINDKMLNQVSGLMARLGITHKRSLPYNAQAKGVIERFHGTVWVPAAKQLGSFMGADMDREARQNVYKLTRKEVKTHGVAQSLPTWRELMAGLTAAMNEYNARPHSALKKIRDPETGKLRHQSPDEAWAEAEASGQTPTRLTQEEAQDLFRPYQECLVRRCQVSVFTNTYYNAALEQYREKVLVGYDIHDPSQVWVRNQAGQLICVAKLDANKHPYFPKSVVEMAVEKRERERLRRIENKREEILAEAEGMQAVTAREPTEAERAMAATQLERLGLTADGESTVQDEAVQSERPLFAGPMAARDRGLWILANPDKATPEDEEWLNQKVASVSFRLLIGLERDDEEFDEATG